MLRTRGTWRGMTVVELLVAILMSLTFLSATTAAFVQITRATDVAERRVRAINNARAALQSMAAEMRAAKINLLDVDKSFYAVNQTLTWGDGVDNDGDGHADEELRNGADEDGDWIDRHIAIWFEYERELFLGQVDMSDERVDEDCLFGEDRVRFYSSSDANPGNDNFDREITYFIGSFDDQDHVLLKTSDYNVGRNPQPLIITEPMAFDVLSFNMLFFDGNVLEEGGGRPASNWPPHWVEDWDSNGYASLNYPHFPLPAAVRFDLEIYVGVKPLEDIDLSLASPIETMRLSTMVTIEQITNTTGYDQLRSMYP
ncbi:hypothetical protein JXA32_04285 [Candidatus Sumerlaeota bacterium]|nr:hypothetical protein [Candidatus Sumerlaeota bacterium]